MTRDGAYVNKNLTLRERGERIDTAIDEIERGFIRKDEDWILETVGPKGEFLDCWEGRMVTPGHLIEAAWFILEESRVSGGDDRLTRIGCAILDWAWEFGWDQEYGGMLYFRDVTGRPVQEYWHRMIHDWTHKLMPDPRHGEWFGYFHRDGRLSTTLKGNLWKGPFHIPRMQLTCWQLLEERL